MLICLTYRCKEASHQAEQNNKTGKRQATQTPIQQEKHPSANKDPAAKNKAKQRKLQATAFPPKLKQRKLISRENQASKSKETRLIWDSMALGPMDLGPDWFGTQNCLENEGLGDFPNRSSPNLLDPSHRVLKHRVRDRCPFWEHLSPAPFVTIEMRCLGSFAVRV